MVDGTHLCTDKQLETAQCCCDVVVVAMGMIGATVAITVVVVDVDLVVVLDGVSGSGRKCS